MLCTAQSLREWRVRPSVCPSVRPSHAGIVSKRRKLVSWFIHRRRARTFQFLEICGSSRNSKGVTPSEGNLWNWGGYELAFFLDFSTYKPPKQCKTGPKLLLNTNTKSHMRFRLVPKSMTLDDPELTLNGHYALFFTLHICLSEPTTKIWMKIDPYCQQ